MTVTINGSGVVTGVTTLPDGIVTNDDLAGSIAETNEGTKLVREIHRCCFDTRLKLERSSAVYEI